MSALTDEARDEIRNALTAIGKLPSTVQDASVAPYKALTDIKYEKNGLRGPATLAGEYLDIALDNNINIEQIFTALQVAIESLERTQHIVGKRSPHTQTVDTALYHTSLAVTSMSVASPEFAALVDKNKLNDKLSYDAIIAMQRNQLQEVEAARQKHEQIVQETEAVANYCNEQMGGTGITFTATVTPKNVAMITAECAGDSAELSEKITTALGCTPTYISKGAENHRISYFDKDFARIAPEVLQENIQENIRDKTIDNSDDKPNVKDKKSFSGSASKSRLNRHIKKKNQAGKISEAEEISPSVQPDNELLTMREFSVATSKPPISPSVANSLKRITNGGRSSLKPTPSRSNTMSR